MEKRKPPSKMQQRNKNASGRGKTLGPVFNLEEHVAPDWWCRIFNHLYLKTDGDVVDDMQITRSEVDLISSILNLSQEHRVLDLCCGQGRHALELARRGFRNVEGLDRSHYLIQKGRERAKSERLAVRFREGDARKLPYPADSFDAVVILGNSFGYFETLQDDLRVLKEVLRVLKPWGKVLIDIADGDYLRDNFQRRSWEWVEEKLFVCRERSLSLDGDRLVSREVVTHVEKGVIADQFYAERLYSQEGLLRLLMQAGFSDTSFPVGISANSRRAQDLGMMERRIIAIAQARKEWKSIRQKARDVEKHVAVVLGDPTKSDCLKPQNVFDDDDFYTIDRMKAALRELKGYRFTYLSNHNSLVQDLLRLAGRINYVFNLCDEGFCNDPRNELHVAAVLELLGIPYTGAGPQCLAHCYDKSLVRGIAKEVQIPVPEAMFVDPKDSTFELSFDFPVIVKPNLGDSSFGITAHSVACEPEELINAVLEIRRQFGYDKPVLVEQYLTGKDLSVGIIGNPPTSYTVLPITEEDYSVLPPGLPWICGYEAKWCPDSPYWKIRSIPAELPDAVEKAIVKWCVELWERLACRDYARFDWRLDTEGSPKLLEVNPNPGWCWDGHLAKMAGYAGMTYAETLGAIMRAAEERFAIEAEESGRWRRESEKQAEDVAEVAGVANQPM